MEKQSRFAYSDTLGLTKISSRKEEKGVDNLVSRVDNKIKELKKSISNNNSLEDDIIKAKKDIAKLVKVKKLITRNGKTFLTTVYENPETGEREEKDKREVALVDRIAKVEAGDRFSIKSLKIKGDFEVQRMYRDKDEVILVCKDIHSDEIKYIVASSIKTISTITKEKETIKKDIPSFSELQYSGISLGGSSGVQLYLDKTGEAYAVKAPHKGDFQQLVQEKIIGDVYRSFKLNVPDQKLDESEGVLISRYIGGSKTLGNTEVTDEIKKEIQKGFVLDALLANWDVVGADADNIIVSENKAYRIDNGGCLSTRARGDSKHYSIFCNEIDTMRDSSKSSAAKYYAGITDGEIIDQIREIDKNIKVFDKLKELKLGKEHLYILKERLSNLKKRYKIEGEILPDKKEIKKEEGEYLRTGMPSLITQKYFDEEWDKVNIEGNPGLKDHIKKHIIEIEAKHKDAYDGIATTEGITVEQVKENMQQWWSELVKRSDGYIVAHSGESYSSGVIDKILISGRFKTQFETETSLGSYHPYGRSVTEREYFGFPDYDSKEGEEIKDLRPIYGYFTEVENGILNREGTIPPPRRVAQYGDVAFKVKKEKFLKDATVTFSDSLGSYMDMAATPASAPHFTSVYPSMDNYTELKNMSKSHSGNTWDYVEAQYHNRLTVDDIESAHISLNGYGEQEAGSLDRVSNVINTITEAVAEAKKPVKIKLF